MTTWEDLPIEIRLLILKYRYFIRYEACVKIQMAWEKYLIPETNTINLILDIPYIGNTIDPNDENNYFDVCSDITANTLKQLIILSKYKIVKNMNCWNDILQYFDRGLQIDKNTNYGRENYMMVNESYNKLKSIIES